MVSQTPTRMCNEPCSEAQRCRLLFRSTPTFHRSSLLNCGEFPRSTITRWFRDETGVLKVGKESKNGRRSRVELRIPVSVAMRVYGERTK